MNKTDYIALIDSKLPSGGDIPSIDHRNTMHTNANSIIEVVYGDGIDDDNSQENKTISNSNCSYKILIFKNGNTITVNGKTTFSNNISNPLIFEVSDSDFYGNGYGVSIDTVNDSPMACTMGESVGGNSLFKIKGNVLAGQTYEFSITYNATN